MSLHFNIFSTVLLMSGVGALLVALVILRSWQPAILWFAIMMIATATWAIGYSFELSSHQLDQMLFWINVEYIGISFLPATWIVFVAHFMGKQSWLTSRSLALIFIFPFLTLAFVITNSWHHIHYESATVDNSGPFPLLNIVPGPWYLVHTVYFYFLLAAGVFYMARHYTKTVDVYRAQTRSILLGATLPWVANFFYLLGIRPYGHIDLTPYAFILTSLVIAFGLNRYKLFNIIPFAREHLIDNLKEGMVVVDVNNKIVDANVTIRKFLSRKSTQLIGSDISDIFPEDAVRRLMARQTDGREEFISHETEGERVYEISATQLADQQNRRMGTLLVFWDITRRKATTERLRKQKTELQELNDIKNKLFSIIAHDLRSPLASLTSVMNLTQSGSMTEEEVMSLMPMLSKNLASTSFLLENLLHWAKSQLAGETVKPEKFDLKKIVQSNFHFFEKAASEKSIRLIDEVLPEVHVFADKNMIDLVVRNLLGNSIKFCESKDSITVRSTTASGSITVEVIDTGVGMEDSVKANLFQLSKPTSVPGTQDERGTGLGLSLCKDFIEKNNGVIWVESEAGIGTSVFFKMPSE